MLSKSPSIPIATVYTDGKTIRIAGAQHDISYLENPNSLLCLLLKSSTQRGDRIDTRLLSYSTVYSIYRDGKDFTRIIVDDRIPDTLIIETANVYELLNLIKNMDRPVKIINRNFNYASLLHKPAITVETLLKDSAIFYLHSPIARHVLLAFISHAECKAMKIDIEEIYTHHAVNPQAQNKSPLIPSYKDIHLNDCIQEIKSSYAFRNKYLFKEKEKVMMTIEAFQLWKDYENNQSSLSLFLEAKQPGYTDFILEFLKQNFTCTINDKKPQPKPPKNAGEP